MVLFKKSVYAVLIVLAGAGLAGCQLVDKPVPVESMQTKSQNAPAVKKPGDAGSEASARRFADAEQAPGAVQTALLWSKKYEEAAAKAEKLEQEKTLLAAENDELKKKVSMLAADLEKTRAELAEAEQFLQQTHAELGKWKADVLGFRDEIRRAQAAELSALAKVLRLLGAEPVELTDDSKPQE